MKKYLILLFIPITLCSYCNSESDLKKITDFKVDFEKSSLFVNEDYLVVSSIYENKTLVFSSKNPDKLILNTDVWGENSVMIKNNIFIANGSYNRTALIKDRIGKFTKLELDANGNLLNKTEYPDIKGNIGTSMAVLDSMIIVGSMHGYNSVEGSVLIFDYEKLIATIHPEQDGGNGGSYFGQALAASDGDIIISAMGQKSVYVYKKENIDEFKLKQKIKCEDSRSGYFGMSMDSNKQYLAIGAPYSSVDENGHFGKESGKVILYKKNRNNQFEKLHEIFPEDRINVANFGVSIDIKGNLLAIGASGKRVGKPDLNGQVFVYKINQDESIKLERKIESTKSNRFGEFVRLGDNKVFIASQSEVFYQKIK